MLVFIDDSGDPSFSINKGATKAFVIACVIFEDELEAEKVAVKLKEFRRKLELSDKFEFKFNKCRKDIREDFLKTTLPFSYKVRAIVMQKEDIYSPELHRSKESFYSYAIKSVLKHSRGTIRNAKIRLDGHGDRIFRNKLTIYLRRELNTKGKNKIINNFRLVDSSQNILIQMADMIAGSIRRKYDSTKTDSGNYYTILSKNKKIDDCWEFGR